MKKYKRIIYLLALFIMLPSFVNADCQSDFDKIQKEFKASYKYVEETDSFTLTFITPNYDRYLFQLISAEDIRNASYVTLEKQLTTTLKNYKGTEYRYQIIAEYPECKDVSVYKSKLILKKYNPYADNPLCVGNEEFVLCQKDYKGELDDETFNVRIEAYIEDKNSNEITNVKNNNRTKSGSSKTTNFFEDNIVLVVIIALIIIAVISFAIVMIKNKVKSGRLE